MASRRAVSPSECEGNSKWLQQLLGLEGNPFDPFGQFMQGVTPALVARELLLRTTTLQRGWWLHTIVVSISLTFSAFYELLEWWVVIYSIPTSARSGSGTRATCSWPPWVRSSRCSCCRDCRTELGFKPGRSHRRGGPAVLPGVVTHEVESRQPARSGGEKPDAVANADEAVLAIELEVDVEARRSSR